MAKAEIHQTFDSQGNLTSLTLSVTCDVIDDPATISEGLKAAVTLWTITSGDDEP